MMEETALMQKELEEENLRLYMFAGLLGVLLVVTVTYTAMQEIKFRAAQKLLRINTSSSSTANDSEADIGQPSDLVDPARFSTPNRLNVRRRTSSSSTDAEKGKRHGRYASLEYSQKFPAVPGSPLYTTSDVVGKMQRKSDMDKLVL